MPGISKDQALAGAIRDQCREVLGALATAHGRREVLDHAITELLHDQVGRKALVGHLEALSDALDKAGTEARAILDRMDHVTEALRS